MKSGTGNSQINKKPISSSATIKISLDDFNGKFNEIRKRLGPPVEVSLDKLGATPEEALSHKVFNLEKKFEAFELERKTEALELKRKMETLEERISFLEGENKILRENQKDDDTVNMTPSPQKRFGVN